MAQKNKKSRFGNPARAAADAAARGKAATSSADTRLERAMASLSPGFVGWLEAQSRPNKSIDASLMILDDFFDLYRIVEPHADPTALVPEAVREVMEVAGHANPLAVLGLRGSVLDYVDYLAQAKLWTGTGEDLVAVQTELARTALAGANDLDFGADVLDPEDYDFADVYIPELTQEEIVGTVSVSPLWQNTVALLTWIGDGREVTVDGAPVEQAAAALSHSGLGPLGNAATFIAPVDHDAARLALYWELLDTAGLITINDSRVRVTEQAAVSLEEEWFMVETMRDLMGHFIFMVTLAGSHGDNYQQWHLDMADWLIQCSSDAPPKSAPLIQALAEPEQADPGLLSVALDVAAWADEGLVTVGEFIEVPPVFRPDVLDLLKDDFNVTAVGPGALQP